MNRSDRETAAKNHVAYINQLYHNEIQESIDKTRIYDKEISDISRNDKPHFYLVQGTTIECVNKCGAWKKTALNFASYLNPGGGYLKGSFAQEEALCADTTLYPVLAAQQAFYKYNAEHKNNSLYEDRLLYTPDICITESHSKLDVITCAAPNIKAACKNNPSKQKALLSENREILQLRLRLIHYAAYEGRTTNLILGAWGCGVFGQQPREVAKYMINEFSATSIPNIYFAIPAGKTFDDFRAVLGSAQHAGVIDKFSVII